MTMNICVLTEDSPHFNHTPLTALSARTRQQLANMLNRKKILRSEEGYERDWRGIAALSQQKNFCDETAITTDNPIEKVLQFWTKNNPQKAKIGYLQQYLGIIDRWDVCDDVEENLQKDTEQYNIKQRNKQIQENVVPIENGINSCGQDFNVITDDDVDCVQSGRPLQKYDAFVLYAECDINKAVEIIEQLESPVFNFKMYLKDRDMLAGIPFEHVELIRLIEDRCKHLIVVLTEDFLRSPENAFLVNYTQALQIHNNIRKIIPIIYKGNMVVPKTLKIYTHLKYNNNVLFNFWDKLGKSLLETEVLTPYYTARELHTPTAPFPDENDNETMLAATPEVPRIIFNDLTDSIEEDNIKMLPKSNCKLRAAHSEGQLNTSVYSSNTMIASSIDLTSLNEKGAKKKKTFPAKILRVFRNSKSKKPKEPKIAATSI